MEWYYWIIIIVLLVLGIIVKRLFFKKEEDIFELGSSRMKKLSDCCKKIFGFGRT
jgi:type IV secretory pathway VirB3-like protein